MHDYNGDGRSNSHDSAIFHNVINSSGGGGSSTGGSSGGVGGGTIGIAFALLAGVEMVKAGWFTGTFGGLITVICLGGLFVLFACWLESL